MAGPVLSANNHPPTLEPQCHHAHPPTFLNSPAPSLSYPPPHQAQPHQYQHYHHHQQPSYPHHPPIPPPPSHSPYTHPQQHLHQPHHHHQPAQQPTPKPTLPGIASILAFAGQAQRYAHPSSRAASPRTQTQSSDPFAHVAMGGPTVEHPGYGAGQRPSICHGGAGPLNRRRRRSSSMTIVDADHRSTQAHTVDRHQPSPELSADLPIASPPVIDAAHSILALSRSTPARPHSDSFGGRAEPEDRTHLRLLSGGPDDTLQRRHSERIPSRRPQPRPASYASPSLQTSPSSYHHPAPAASSSTLPHASYLPPNHPSWTSTASPPLLPDSTSSKRSPSSQRRLSTTSASSTDSNLHQRPIIITSPALLATGPSTNRYQCPESGCGKTFSRPSSLKIHTYSHTGQKPFKCLRCDRAFSVQSNLKRHQKVHERRNGKSSGSGRAKESSPMVTTGPTTGSEEGGDESDLMEAE